jgi:hypothetical protein
MTGAPFQKGQRVRMTAMARLAHPKRKYYSGVVTRCRPVGPLRIWYVSVRYDESKCKTQTQGHASEWELIPTADLTADQTAQSLADAVKLGDTNAALVLADHIFELYGGTKTPAPEPEPAPPSKPRAALKRYYTTIPRFEDL